MNELRGWVLGHEEERQRYQQGERQRHKQEDKQRQEEQGTEDGKRTKSRKKYLSTRKLRAAMKRPLTGDYVHVRSETSRSPFTYPSPLCPLYTLV